MHDAYYHTQACVEVCIMRSGEKQMKQEQYSDPTNHAASFYMPNQ